jgi:hypothetical protein
VLFPVLPIKLPKVISMIENDNVTAARARLVLGGSEPLKNKVKAASMDIEVRALLFVLL